jgi:hypothetical protein
MIIFILIKKVFITQAKVKLFSEGNFIDLIENLLIFPNYILKFLNYDLSCHF